MDISKIKLNDETYNIKDIISRENSNAIKPFLKGKKVLVIGDSISAENEGQNNWVTLLREIYTPFGTTITNMSKSGATLAGASGELCLNYLYATTITEQYDVIIIEAGINDFYQQFPIGQLSPTFADPSYFNGALMYLYNQIYSKNKSAEVFYLAPFKSAYELEHPLPVDLYRLLIYNACNMFNWHFIDSCNEVPFENIYNGIRDWTDGVHPNNLLTPYLAKYIDERVNNYGGNYISYQRNKMDLTQFCLSVKEGVTLALEFDTNQQSIITLHGNNISMVESAGQQLAILPTWIRPTFSASGCGVLNGVYPCNVTITTDGQIVLLPTTTINNALYDSTINIPLNLLIPKVYA